jgi:hypothetical protein
MRTLCSTDLELVVNCLICSNIMQEPVTMHCGHSFCRACTLKWCIHYKHLNCPVCRKKLDRQLPNVNVTLKLLIEHLTGKNDSSFSVDKNSIMVYNQINKNSSINYQTMSIDHEELLRKVANELENVNIKQKNEANSSLSMKDSTLSRLSFVKFPFYFVLTVYGFIFLFFLSLIKRFLR